MLDNLKRVRDAMSAEVSFVRRELQDVPADDDPALDALEGKETALGVALRLVDAASSDLARRVAAALEELPPAPGDSRFQAGYVDQVRRIVAALRTQDPGKVGT